MCKGSNFPPLFSLRLFGLLNQKRLEVWDELSAGPGAAREAFPRAPTFRGDVGAVRVNPATQREQAAGTGGSFGCSVSPTDPPPPSPPSVQALIWFSGSVPRAQGTVEESRATRIG